MKIPTSCPQTQMTLSPRSPTAQKVMAIRTVWTVLFILLNKVLFRKEFTVVFFPLVRLRLMQYWNHYAFIVGKTVTQRMDLSWESRTRVCISLPWTFLWPQLVHLKQNALGEVTWMSPCVSIAICKGVLQHLNAMVKRAGNFFSEGTSPIWKHTENNCIVWCLFVCLFLNLVSVFCLYSSPFCLPPGSFELSLLMLFSMRIKKSFSVF